MENLCVPDDTWNPWGHHATWNKSVTKRQTPRITWMTKFMESIIGAGGRGTGNWHLMGTEFQFLQDKKSSGALWQTWMYLRVRLKMIKTVNSVLCVFHHSLKRTKMASLLSVLQQPGWEGSLGENGYMCMEGWEPSLFTYNYHNIVNQLYSNTK